MNVLMRVDASPVIGTGHLMRSLALARGLSAHGATILFACRNLASGMLDQVMAEYSLVTLPAQYGGEQPATSAESCVPWLDDLAALEMALAGQRFDWCVVDHYGLDACWEEGAHTFAERLMAIDDLANRPHAAELLLDQNLTANEAAYADLLPGQCRLLLGPTYALLRHEFTQGIEHVRDQAVRRVFVNFGGADPTGETLKAMHALASFDGLEVEVIAGKANPDWQTIKARCEQRGWRAAHHVDDIAVRMSQADIGIGAGGTSTWERAAVGLPTLCIAVADNQVENARLMAELGGQIYLGESKNVTEAMIATSLSALMADGDLRLSLTRQSRRLVDGQGVERVCDVLMSEPWPHMKGDR